VYELCDHASGRVVKRVEIAAAGQPLMITKDDRCQLSEA
jgi:hypothetical protein